MTLLKSIRKTISYAKRYNGGLDIDKLYFRLIDKDRFGPKKIRATLMDNNLKLPTKEDKYSAKKLEIAREFAEKHLKRFKNIILVGVTGSVAAGNARENDDIDFLIVCRSGTLWITRLMVRAYVWGKRIPHRKFGQPEKSNDLCFNLWLDESNMQVPSDKQTVKNGIDLILMNVVYNVGDTYKKLIGSNLWAKVYVANGYHEVHKSVKHQKESKYKTSIIMRGVNYISYVCQIAYMRKKSPLKYIDLTQAFFHK